MDPGADLGLANRLADLARSVIMALAGGPVQARRKRDGSLVTDADRQVEEEWRAVLAIERSDDGVSGEEGPPVASRSGRRWLLDPIDGTHSFVDGGDDWGVLIALEADREVVVGVVDFPARDLRCWTVAGGGSWAREGKGEPVRLRVSDQSDVSPGRLLLPHRTVPGLEGLERAFGRSSTLFPAMAQASYLVASGQRDGLAYGSDLGPWDLAATSLLVTEAGGRASDAAARPTIESGSAVYTNGLIHDHILGVAAGRILP